MAILYALRALTALLRRACLLFLVGSFFSIQFVEQQTAAGITFYLNPTTGEVQWSPPRGRSESRAAARSTSAAATGGSDISQTARLTPVAPPFSVGNTFDDGAKQGPRAGSYDARVSGGDDSVCGGNDGLPDHIEVRISEGPHRRKYYVNHRTKVTSWNPPPPSDW